MYIGNRFISDVITQHKTKDTNKILNIFIAHKVILIKSMNNKYNIYT